MPVEDGYPEKVQLQEHQEARTESVPKLAKPVGWHGNHFTGSIGNGGTNHIPDMRLAKSGAVSERQGL
jgi:hypothetical protein